MSWRLAALVFLPPTHKVSDGICTQCDVHGFSQLNGMSAFVDVFRAFNATEQRLATEAVSYWTSFARSSSPSTFKPSDSPEWPELSPRDQKGAQRIVLQIGNSGQTGSLVETLSERYIERCLVSDGLDFQVLSCQVKADTDE